MIVLASGSATRRQLLERAGLDFIVDTAPVDEAAVKRAFTDPVLAAEALAELKAVRVSPRHPGALVIGADQMLDCDGAWFDKPDDAAAARLQLATLRGHRHRLTSAVAVIQDGRCLWRHTEAADLTMRPFSDAFLESYLAARSAPTTSRDWGRSCFPPSSATISPFSACRCCRCWGSCATTGSWAHDDIR